ncbi:MAG TPA: aminotransferase class III-fold pyridoxal phosphate-dependent enzyme, partial [Deferrimonas sp.]
MESDRTESLRRRDKASIWHPFTQMADWEKDDPLVIERGEGNYLYDTDGNRYFDGVSSLWVNLFGHRRKEIDDA